jgi:RNA polymerase sigma-70 factor, ECF subfamily
MFSEQQMPVLLSPNIFFRQNRTLTSFNPSFKHARPTASGEAFAPRPDSSGPPRPGRRPVALEQLLRNSHAPLRRYITRLAGADLADDILQETSIQIFRKLQFLREPAVFQAWTLRIASRIAVSHLKRAHRWQPLDDSPLGAFTPNPDLGDPPDAAFFSLLDRVSPASRAVFLLHYQHDLSLEETAAILDIPVGTAKSRLHYGVATLRKHLTLERKLV